MEYNTDNPKSAAPSWLLPFGSLMTLFLAITLLMLSFSQVDQAKLTAAANSIKATVGLAAMPSFFTASKTSTQTTAMEFEQAILLVQIKQMLEAAINSQAHTKFLTIQPAVKPALKQLASFFATRPNLIRIEGHSNDQPLKSGIAYPNNWAFSAAAAATIAHFFTTECQIDPTQLMVLGLGPYAPAQNNTTEEGRAHNQRIDILLTHEVRPGAIKNQTPPPPDHPSTTPNGKT